MRPVRRAHGIGIGVGPHHEVLGYLIAGMALGNGLDQRPFKQCRAAPQRHRLHRGIMGFFQDARQLDRVELAPAPVVDRASGIGDAPPCHGAFGVGFGRTFEAAQRFLEVEAIGPGQATVEPGLRGL